jgi:hypothetical protein
MTLRTTVKTFNFDISTEAGRKGWEALKKEQCENKSALFSALGTYYFPELEGKTVELETKHLFSNQWNSACGKRLFDFACEVLPRNQAIKRGHYLTQTKEMQELRDNTHVCGYCGHQESAQKGAVFCGQCIDSEYLTQELLPTLRMLPTSLHMPMRGELSTAEAEHLIPLFKQAQRVGSTARGKQRLINERSSIQNRFVDVCEVAKIEKNGKIWMLDNGISTKHAIYYSHTKRWAFGWSTKLTPSERDHILNVISEFPFDYDILDKPKY